MIIAVDVDGTVADLHAEWLRRYNLDYNDTLCSEACNDWALDTFVKPECGKKIYKYLEQPDLYDCVKPIPGALETIELLRSMGHRVVFATSTTWHQAGKKLKWLERNGFVTLKHGMVCSDYVECHDKSLIKASCLIDDGVHNLEVFQGNRILFDGPWNRSCTKFMRMLRWDPENPCIEEADRAR